MQNKAALDSIESAGLGSYQFLAALDRRTCPVCGSLDGRIFSVEEYSQGETAPPLHVRCRCTICASVEGVKRKSRIAERREKIPGNVTYEQWKAKYIAIFKASNEKKPQYPPYNKANILAKEEYAKLRNIAEANNISLSNVKKFDGGVETLKQLVETLAQYKAVFPNVFDDRYKLTLSLSGTMDAEDFAITRGRIITLNANAYRDVGILQGEYQELVNEGWFVKGTDWRAIIHHEFGHVVANVYKLDPLKIACEVTGMDSKSTLNYLKKTLSEYAGSFPNGQEIISEVFAEMSTGKPSEFSRKFYDKVLKLTGGGVNGE